MPTENTSQLLEEHLQSEIMSPWINVYENRFHDVMLDNHRARSGSLLKSNPAPQIFRNSDAISVSHYFAKFWGSQWAHYKLKELISEIIGIRFTAYFRLHRKDWAINVYDRPMDYSTGTYTLFSMENYWRVKIKDGRLKVEAQSTDMEWRELYPSPDVWFRVDWHWRNDGSAVLYLNNNQVALRNDIYPGHILGAANLWIGCAPTESSEPIDLYQGDIGYLRLSVMRKQDIDRMMTGQIPFDKLEIQSLEECYKKYRKRMLPTKESFEKLQRKFLQKETTNWQYNKMDETGFTDRFQQAKTNAEESANLTIRYLQYKESSVKQKLLQNIKVYLEALATTEFLRIWNQFKKQQESGEVDKTCLKVISGIYNHHSDQLSDLEELLKDIMKIMQSIVKTISPTTNKPRRTVTRRKRP